MLFWIITCMSSDMNKVYPYPTYNKSVADAFENIKTKT